MAFSNGHCIEIVIQCSGHPVPHMGGKEVAWISHLCNLLSLSLELCPRKNPSSLSIVYFEVAMVATETRIMIGLCSCPFVPVQLGNRLLEVHTYVQVHDKE